MIEEAGIFVPERKKGLIIYGTAAALMGGGGVFSFFYAVYRAEGTGFILFLLLALLLLSPLVWLLNRFRNLLQAEYQVSRDGLQLRWGLRREVIPLPEIEWLHPIDDLTAPLPLPPLHFSGILRGSTYLEGLGTVEFMASDVEKILLVGTSEQIVAISPQDTQGFIRVFTTAFERGSLSPLAPYSHRPPPLLGGVWNDKRVRVLVLSGLILTLLLLVLVSLIVPTQNSISLGFDNQTNPLPPGPPEYLLLLPILALFFYAVDLLLGAYYYREGKQRIIAYLMWGSGVMTPLLLLMAVWYIVRI